MQIDSKLKNYGKGLLDVTFFNFSKFCEAYFKKIQPQQLTRDKLIFNFLWSIHHSKNNDLVELVIDILQDRLELRDLLNLLMVKDFVKLHLRKNSGMTYFDFG